MRLPDAPRPPRSCLDLARSPTSALDLDAMRAAAWHRHGVVALSVEDIADPWLRQAIANEANRRWGRRDGGTRHGR
ncbi:hypothetical protein CR162_16425 [Pseudoroseomonas rhizosphaerae]|uniref:Uncharacterized protein n=1 Tax=Teichococcus rhizosphaerae TaxID=1335062 RepID=A0A2C7A925_9PROT|nr:hypothetical protein [Pseudoroseomonas rhizosphaerae]PHK93855.1 hypothetical protein CR162_16425 [Pseudoroseomonas rhizosphaerae]